MYYNQYIELRRKTDTERILNVIQETANHITDFIETFAKEQKNSASFEDWDAKDVVFHINSWMGFAAKKLKDIKTGDELDNVSDIDGFNIANYQKTVNSNLNAAQKAVTATIQELMNIATAYTEEELILTSFPTGFSFELWKYIVMDGYVHPNMHLMQYYIESGFDREFIELALKCKGNFLEYAGNNIGVFFFGEYFNNDQERRECFEKFKRRPLAKDDFIEKIVQVNI